MDKALRRLLTAVLLSLIFGAYCYAQYPATDSFGSLGALNSTNWGTPLTAPTATVSIVASTAQGAGLTANFAIGAAYWKGEAFNNNQYAQVTIGAYPTGNTAGVCVRLNAAGTSGYCVKWGSPISGNLYLYKVVSGVLNYLNAAAQANVAGGIVKLTASGTTLDVFYNGSSIFTQTDSTYASGSPGIWIDNSNTSVATNQPTVQSFSADCIPTCFVSSTNKKPLLIR